MAEKLVSAIIAAVLGTICYLAFQSRVPQDVNQTPAQTAPLPTIINVPTPAPAPPANDPNAAPSPAPAPVIVPVPWPDYRYPWPWRPWYPFPYPGPGPWAPYRPYEPYRPREPRRPEPHNPGPHPGPHKDASGDSPGKPVIGGPIAPDGKTEITCDLPANQKKKNVGGRDGLGLCVFTSIEYAARFQNVRDLQDLQKYMRTQPGGGYPHKVDSVLKRFAPDVLYGQHTGGDEKVLDAILQSGRMASMTYNGHDPHYGNKSIAHMIDLVYLDQEWACVNDNNYPDEYVWMSRAELLKRWRGGGGGGWVVFLLSPPPPPMPKPWLATKPA